MSFRPYFLNGNFFSEQADVASYSAYDQSSCGNVGNAYITYSVIKALYGRLTSIEGIRNFWKAKYSSELMNHINSDFSHAILILQDHIREDFKGFPFDEVTRIIEGLRIPLIVFSLGANSLKGYEKDLHLKLSDSQVRFFKAISEKSVSLGVRGAYTAEVLSELGILNVTIVGCPSYFEAGLERRIRKLSLPSDFKVIATGAFSNLDSQRLHYFFQDEAFFLKLLYFPDAITEKDRDLLLMRHPGYADCVLQAIDDERAQFHTNIDDWKRSVARGFAFCAGSRIHGAIIAMNSGIPALVTNGDARAREMTELFGSAYRKDVGYWTPLSEIYESIDVSGVNARYPELYVNYRNWLSSVGLKLEETASQDELLMPEVIRKDRAEIRRGLIENLSVSITASVKLNEHLEQRILASDARIEALEGELKEKRRQIDSQNGRIEELSNEVNQLRRVVVQINETVSRLRDELAGTLQSLSWRITAPLRAIGMRCPRAKSWLKTMIGIGRI